MSSESLDWAHLRSFLAIARVGRLVGAARQLGVTHSTLSRHITALEQAIGARLFDRNPAGFILTAAGERLLSSVDTIDSILSEAHADLSQARARASGIVRIGAPDGFGVGFLAPRLPALSQMHPELEVQLVTTPRFPSLSRREADIGIGLSRPSAGRLFARKLVDYDLGIYAARSNAAAQPEEGGLSLTDHLFVGYIDELLFTRELDYLPLVERNLRPRMKSSNLLAQQQMIAAGYGIGMLPAFLARHDPRLVRIRRDISIRRTFWMIVHSDLKDLARVRVTMDFLVSQAQSERALFQD